MKIILQQNITKLGKKNDVVEVKPGYARNYLFPQNMAILATPNALDRLEAAREKEAVKLEKLTAMAEELRGKINNAKVELKKMAEGTKLFGSVSKKELRTALSAAINHPVGPGMIKLKSPIKEIGTYQIAVELTETVSGKFTLSVKKG